MGVFVPPRDHGEAPATSFVLADSGLPWHHKGPYRHPDALRVRPAPSPGMRPGPSAAMGPEPTARMRPERCAGPRE